MSKTINIGTEINLEDLVKSRMLIQANSGGGKSAIARVIMEECYGKIPFIVMDIDGEYYTLKELFGDIIVIGGQHADVKISLELARLLPKLIIENQLSVVIDVSDMEMNQRMRFAKLFLESLMSLSQQYWVPYLIFLEECHKLAGEQDKYESGPAVKDLMSRGRKRGYCGIPITQRISKLHKDVAAECNNKFIGRTYLDIDMDRSAKELGFSKASDRLKLRDLQPGSFYAFGTSIKPHEVHQVKIKRPQTKMPQAGSAMAIVSKAPTNKIISILGKLNEDLKKETDKKATTKTTNLPVNPLSSKDANLLQSYKAEIELLKIQAREKEAELLKWKKEIEIKDQSNNKLLKQLIDNIRKAQAELSKGILLEASDLSTAQLITVAATKMYKPGLGGVQSVKQIPVKDVIKTTIQSGGNGTLGKCSREVIRFLAQYPDRQFSKAQVAIATGYSAGSGGFNNALSELNQRGFIIRGGKLQVNQEAIEQIVNTVGHIPEQDYNIETYKNNLGKCEREIYEVLLQQPEKIFTKEELSQSTETEYSHGSGGFNNALSRLNTLELIERKNGQIRLNPELLELMV